ncbi:MAG: ATP-binding cassette domain-containing protein [Candidatus Omnitrophica bacterium]|nr:ATP-binding cassette domain-containing protein [Candidatus Omnitrophota bacterium]
MIQVSNVYKSFNGQPVLDNINFKISSGEIVVILGESGTGKSVLLNNMMGLLKPDQGQIMINGQDITQLKEKQLLELRKSIGFLFQEGALYDFMNCFDNIAFPLREHTRLKEKDIRIKIEQILKLIDLQGVEKKFPSQLSGGMKKRVALGRAIVLDSKILFCDEPTSGLDPIRSRDISDLIRNVSKKLNCTTVVTSHDIKNSLRIADRLILLSKGRILLDGSREAFEQSSVPEVQAFIK